MFGYIRPYVPALRVGDYEYYRAAYCAVCRELGKQCGGSARFCLSYDAVFLALLRDAATGQMPNAVRHSCVLCPISRRTILEGSDGIRYAALVCAILSAMKVRDDREDEKGLRRAAAGAAAPFSSGWLKRAKKRCPGLCEGLQARIEAYEKTEKRAAEDSSVFPVDLLAGSFGELMAFTASFGLEGDAAVVCAAIGRHIGRWVFCVDALDDLKKDRELGRFNPFLSAYPSGELTPDEKVTVGCLLDAEAASAADALALLDTQGRPEARLTVLNILRSGLPHVTAAVMNGTYRKPRREKLGSLADSGEPDQKSERKGQEERNE